MRGAEGDGRYDAGYTCVRRDGGRPVPWQALAPTEVTIAADRVQVRNRFTRASWVLERAEVEQVVRLPRWQPRARRSPLAEALAFLLVDGGAWDVLVRPAWLDEVLEARGWPVDRAADVTWEQVLDRAVRSPPATPPWYATRPEP